MRLIDADALRDALEQADLDVRGEWDHMQWEKALDAAPTIPTTETNNGVTSCAFCGCVVDIEYLEES